MEYERSLEHLREAERLATAIGDQHRLGQVYGFLAFSAYQSGDLKGAIEYGRRAIEIARERDDPHLEAVAYFFTAQAYFFHGDFSRALECYERSWSAHAHWRSTERSPVLRRPAVVRSWSALCRAEVGRFADALAYSKEAEHAAETSQEPFSQVAADFGAGTLYLHKGDLERAIPTLERGLERCRASEVGMYAQRLLAALGYGYCLSGRVAEGVKLLEDAVELYRSKRLAASKARTEVWMAEAYLLAGRAEDALRAAARALETAREYGEQSSEAWGLRLLGEIAARRDPPDGGTADGHFRQAMTLAQKLEMRPLVAHCHLGLGGLYRRTGDRAKAEEHLATATTMYGEMDMGFYLAQAEAKLGR
jgi:tetratricopeptide (TPR) repeat protein